MLAEWCCVFSPALFRVLSAYEVVTFSTVSSSEMEWTKLHPGKLSTSSVKVEYIFPCLASVVVFLFS